MDRLDYFERGRELYNGKRYEEAAEHFLLSIVKERSNVSRAWLANCYEKGLGVEKDLLMAKDLYHVSYNNIGHSKRNTKFCAWVQERLEQLKDIVDSNSMSRFIDDIGPEKSLEALCIHELTHSFVRGHDKDFHDKMLELGGQEMCDLDNKLWKEKNWLYLDM